MKNPILALFRTIFVCAVALISIVSCGLVSDPQVAFVSIPGEISQYTAAGFDNSVAESRFPAGGFVYVVASLKGSVLRKGPLPLTPGKDFALSGLPRGSYDTVLLYYTPEQLDQDAVDRLPLPGEDLSAFWELVSATPVAGDLLNNSGALALFKDFTISLFRRTRVEATLVPLSSILFIGPDGSPPRCPDTADAMRKQFFRLEPNGAASLYVMLSNFDGAGIVYAGSVSLYSASGKKLETHAFNRDITPEGPESVLFTLPFDAVSYLYLEYAAKGDRALPVFYF